jgi:hypothetical protein
LPAKTCRSAWRAPGPGHPPHTLNCPRLPLS